MLVVVVVARSGAARRGVDGRRWEGTSRWEQCQCQPQRYSPGVGVVGVVPGREGRGGVGRSTSGVSLGAPLLQGNPRPMEQRL